ncbi:MAG: DNA/RNA non-specific endonuclease [Desulfuromonadaceae bacterium]
MNPSTRLLITIAIVFSTFTNATHGSQTSCPEHFTGGTAPEIVNEKLAVMTRELCNSGYGTLHSGLTRTPLYAGEHLTREHLIQGKGLKRQSQFHADDRLPHTERAELNDYARSGYDRGHLAPSGDMFDLQSQHETFALSNMIPQEPSVNRGVWERIESKVRQIAKARGELFVVTGPLYQGADLKRIGSRVLVPTAIFKAVFEPARNEAGAYVVENTPGAEPQIVSIANLNRLTGLDVFPTVSSQVKNRTMQLPIPKPRKGKGIELHGGRYDK